MVTNSKQKEPLIHSIYDFIELFLIAVCIVFLLFSFAVRLCRVDGPSMMNTLYHGESLLVSDLFYRPKGGDVIVFHQTGIEAYDYNELIVKRIIATEGQYVKVERDAVYVSDDDTFDENERLDESAYAYMDVGYMKDRYNIRGKTFEVPKGHVFVMGDNRNNSDDSRSPLIGFVDTRRIVGKVILRVAPVSRFGTVD